MCSRKWQQYLKVIVLTSLVWCMLDVWILTYFSNCADNASAVSHKVERDIVNKPLSIENAKEAGDKEPPHSAQKSEEKKDGNLFQKLMDKVPQGNDSLLSHLYAVIRGERMPRSTLCNSMR